METQDANGTRVQLTEDGLTYGEEFVSFDEMGGVQSVPHNMFDDSSSNLSDVMVLRKNGPDLLIRDVPAQPANQISRRVGQILQERH